MWNVECLESTDVKVMDFDDWVYRQLVLFGSHTNPQDKQVCSWLHKHIQTHINTHTQRYIWIEYVL